VIGQTIKALHTDSTGTYTVIIGQDGERSIYMHKTKKLLKAGQAWDSIDGVITEWENNKAFFATRKGLFKYYFDEDGNFSLSSPYENECDYFEEVFTTLKVKTNSIAKARLFSIVTAKKRYNHLLSKILTSLFDIIAAIFLFFISNH
jgi:hypothetical protein